MRILDIDMDFFLDYVAHFKGFDGTRLSDEEYSPWEVSDVRKFLEENCGLSKTNRVHGAIFTEHVGVFHIIRELIDKGLLSTPIEIDHIDAHADLGLGDSAWYKIFSSLLDYSVNDRLNVILEDIRKNETGKVSSGNYLLYMISLEWISSLTYVPHFREQGDDYPNLIMKSFDDNSNIIQLKNYSSNFNFHELNSIAFEPQYEVPFNIVHDYTKFHSSSEYDYVFFSQSISYTPKAADILLDIFRDYIDFENFRDSIA